MPTTPLVLALCAAFVHAGWNLLLSRARDSEAATAVALVAGALAFAPVAAATWQLSSGALPYAAGSAALEFLYLGLLARAYQEGELSVVYPVARGSAPLLILLFSLAVLGASLDAASIAGICLVAGLGMFGAFGLALAAIRLAPSSSLAAVQAVRETSVVIAVVAARLVLRERVTGPRMAGAVAVVAGVAAIAAA